MANQYCECEQDNSREEATLIKVGKAYTRYLGSGLINSDYRDDEDNYKIQLIKGQVYRLSFGNKQGLTIIKMHGKDSEPDNVLPSVEANKFCVADGQTFIAPYSGTYYIRIYNHFGAQYKYSVKVTNVSLNKVSLTTVKAGKASLTANWKKVSCSGYQIQYSTNRNFKSAKTVSVAKNKTSTTIKKLSSKKKYYVRIRTYTNVDKKKAYSSWSAVKSVNVK